MPVNQRPRPSTAVVVAPDNSKFNRYADYLCDGTADDVQIQAAIDAVGAAGGGIVFIKAGTYNISVPINILYNQIYLTGESMEAVILQATSDLSDTEDIIHIGQGTTSYEDTLIQNMTIDGTSNYYARYCIYVDGALSPDYMYTTKINRVTAKRVGGNCARINNTFDLIVTESFFQSPIDAAQCIDARYVERFVFRDNFFSAIGNTTSYGLLIRHSSNNGKISNNHFYDIPVGLRISDDELVDADGCKYITVEGNQFQSCDYGIINEREGSYINFTDNYFYDATYGLYVGGQDATHKITNTSIKGNHFVNCSTKDLYLVSNVDKTRILGNDFSGTVDLSGGTNNEIGHNEGY